MRRFFQQDFLGIDSAVHRAPAGAKLAAALTVVLCTVLMPVGVTWYFAGLVLGLALVAGLSRLPLGALLQRLLLLEPFVLGVAVLALFQPDGGWRFLGIVVKSSLCLLTMVLLSSTTSFAALLQVLHRVHVPFLLITTLALMYRYLFVLAEETERMQLARTSRTFLHGRRRTWRSLATIIALLFVRSTERADRIYAAMCARGWK